MSWLTMPRFHSPVQPVHQCGGRSGIDLSESSFPAFGMLLRRCDRHSSFFDQLNRLLVHTDHRKLRILSLVPGFEHFFHAGHEFGILFRWNHPVPDFSASFYSNFFSVLRTVFIITPTFQYLSSAWTDFLIV
ncbi:MAG: hypothetical protein DWI24_03935 [Planctomycetota bacterium]|nr:MAG: hypothetical protein DWI24_03935 [Planctomycetota bacterium]